MATPNSCDILLKRTKRYYSVYQSTVLKEMATGTFTYNALRPKTLKDVVRWIVPFQYEHQRDLAVAESISFP